MRLFEALLNTFWQGAALALLAWAAMRWIPRINAATRCAVWWAVLAVIVLLPAAYLKRPPAPEPRVGIRATPLSVAAAPSDSRFAPRPDLRFGWQPDLRFTPREPQPREFRPRFELRPGSWLEALAGIWLAVFVGQMARVAASLFYLRRLKREARQANAGERAYFDGLLESCGVRRRARLLLSQRVASPVAVGFLRPAAILPESLPANLTDAELKHVLLHEIAHIARRDDWFHLAATVAWSVLALHPVAAWVLRRIAREREIACDDWVVAATGSPRPYAQSLARLFELCASRRRILLASGIAGSGSQLGDRIALLLQRGRAFTAQVSLVRVAISAVLLTVFLVGAAARVPSWIVFAHPAATHRVMDDGPADSEPQPVVVHTQTSANAPAAVAGAPHSFLAAVVAAGYGDLPVDDIVNLKVQGVTGEYLLGMSRAGWGKLRPSAIVNLKVHGVSPEYVKQIHALGYGPYTPEEVVNLKIQGVPVELFRDLKDYGFSQLTINELIDAKIHGVNGRHLREARSYGSTLTLRQIVKLKQAGVL